MPLSSHERTPQQAPEFTGIPYNEPTRPDLLRERDDLRSRVQQLEEELSRYRAHEQRLSRALYLASDHAHRIREEARREAELALRKARAAAEATLADVVAERRRAERELLRLRNLVEEMRAGLSTFLVATLSELEDGNEDAPARSRLELALENSLDRALGNAGRKLSEPS